MNLFPLLIQNGLEIRLLPYYEDDSVTIYNTDFRNLNVSPYLVIADPPFNIWHDVAESVSQIDTKSTALFTNWQNRNALEVFGKPRAELVWVFSDGRWVSHSLPRITHETILVYGLTGYAYVGRSMAGIKPQNKSYGSVGKDKMAKRDWVPRERALINSHIAYPRNVHTGVWTKPLPLMKQLVEWLCPEGETVFDPFMGSGTTLIAARDLNRKAIGCDVSREMCDLTIKNLKAQII